MQLAKLEVTADLEESWRVLCNPDEESGGAHISNNSGEQEWYTPKEFIDSAKASVLAFPAVFVVAALRSGLVSPSGQA
jgi:hypothetical protein